MNKIRFVVDLVDTVIRIAQLIKSELSKKEEDSKQDQV